MVVVMGKHPEPLQKPPPTGSVWEAIERERLALGWSARELSTQALGQGSASHFSLTSSRQNWESVAVSTQKAYVDALVRAGVPRERLEPGIQVPVADECEDEIALAQEAAGLLARTFDITIEEAWLEFLDPLPQRYKGEAWTVTRLFEAAVDNRKRRLGQETEAIIGPDDPTLGGEPGPDKPVGKSGAPTIRNLSMDALKGAAPTARRAVFVDESDEHPSGTLRAAGKGKRAKKARR